MKPSSPDPLDTELATGFTVRAYEAASRALPPERDKIADALHARFMERYIAPATKTKHHEPHGFTVMAISCLTIEALESFREGWKDSNRRSELAFCRFFACNDEFQDFRSQSQQFYKNVRCGILHQAETTGGWRITRKKGAPLLADNPPTINAELFLENLRLVLDRFRDQLKAADWDSQDWKHVRTKMGALCDNCRPTK